MIFRNLGFDSNLIMNPPYPNIFLFLVTRANVSLHSVTREICLASNKSPHAHTIFTYVFLLQACSLPPPLFLFPPPSPTRISRRCLSPTLEFPTFSPRMNVMRNDSTQALYTSKHTSHRIRIVTMIRKRSA